MASTPHNVDPDLAAYEARLRDLTARAERTPIADILTAMGWRPHGSGYVDAAGAPMVVGSGLVWWLCGQPGGEAWASKGAAARHAYVGWLLRQPEAP